MLPEGSSDDDSIKGLFVLPYDQPISPNTNECSCKYVLNHKLVFKDAKNLTVSNATTEHLHSVTVGNASNDKTISLRQKAAAQSAVIIHSKVPVVSSEPNRKKGLQGNMLGAQRKTAQHLAAVPRSAVKKDEEAGTSCGSTASSQAAINTFREGIHQQLLQFNRDEHRSVVKISVSLADILRKLDPSDREGRLAIKMDVLKYIVYEAVEEIGELDNWIAHKEPSEFLDEVNI